MNPLPTNSLPATASTVSMASGLATSRTLAVLMFRRLGASPEDADDLAQELVIRGSQVTWRSVKNLHADRCRARHAKKRGGGCEHVSIEEAFGQADTESGATADRRWAQRIFVEATGALNVRADDLLDNEKPGHMDRLQWHRLKRKVAARIRACLGGEDPRYFCQALCA
jgi:DNA-directed RNA polymerase specialized sigma24 family protein